MNESAGLNNINSNGSDGLVKSGQQMAMKYDELQAHASKFEHELSVNGNGLSNYPAQPKHIRFPDVPYSSELVNELMIFLYTMFATAMQFLHLYRTVFWLPESNTNGQTMVNIEIVPANSQLEPMHAYLNYNFFFFSIISILQNFYLIDEHLTMFIVILLGRRFMYCFLIGTLEMICPKRIYHVAHKFIR